MVSQGRGLETHGVEEGDVGAAPAGNAQHRRSGFGGGGEVAGAGDEVVAGAEDQSVAGVLAAETVENGGKVFDVGQRAGGAIHVGGVEELQGEHRPVPNRGRLGQPVDAFQGCRVAVG